MIGKIKACPIHITLLLLIFISLPGNAQDNCGDEKINEAQKKYDIGLFFEIDEYLQPCIKKGFSDFQKVEAYRLIAISNLATDSVNACISASVKLLDIKPNFEPSLFDPPGFIKIINDIKKTGQQQLITSVSKKEENVLEAPATVIVITEQEIINRGYQDVEQIFHDLPGFDISKGRGPNYSNLYQRGYRSITTDRTILLIDGVEQNDLTSDNAPISRQYPLSNIKRIEVIYGPASTMYGANAFLGVVNIVTKPNDEIIEKEVGINVHSGFSSMNTKFLDAVIGVKGKNISFSLTGRYHQSNGMDLSSYDSWNFNHDDVDYFQGMNITGTDASGAYYADDYIKEYRLDTLPTNDLYQVTYNTVGVATDITLTETGASKAFNLDNTVLNDNQIGMDASSEGWYIKGRMQTGNFIIAIETWKFDEKIGRAHV